MSKFASTLTQALRTKSPLEVLYALGIRGKSARAISQRLAQGQRPSATAVVSMLEDHRDFACREELGELSAATRRQILWRLCRREIRGAEHTRPGSLDGAEQRLEPTHLLAAARLYEAHELDTLASQKGFPPDAVENYIELLAQDLSPEDIRQIFPEGYLFKDYFFWIDSPFKNAYVYKFKDEYYFYFPGKDGQKGFRLKSKDYGRLMLKALNAMAAYHLGKAATDLHRLQVVPTRNCNDTCEFCPFVLDNNHVAALTNEQADTIIEFLNDNPGITSLQFVGNGEPFLNFPVILRILRGVKHVEQVALYSNGFWGDKAKVYLPALAQACPQAEVTINLAMDVQHSPRNTSKVKTLVRDFSSCQDDPHLTNIKLHIRGLIFGEHVVASDPVLTLLDELGVEDGPRAALLAQFEAREKVKLAGFQGRLLISYNFLRSPSDPSAVAENVSQWFPALVVTDEGTLGIGSYEVASPIASLEDLAADPSLASLTSSNILLHYLQSPILVDTLKELLSLYPRLAERTYIATDILRNIFREPADGLAFVTSLYQAEVRRDPRGNAFLAEVLADLDISAEQSLEEVRTRAASWVEPSVPAAVTRKTNWWHGHPAEVVQGKAQANRWLSLWDVNEQARAAELQASFDPRAIEPSIEEFLQNKYGLSPDQYQLSCIALTGSSIYRFSQVEPPTDVDYIAVVDHPGITDILHVPGTNNSVWLVSEENLQGNSTKALHVDFAINIEHGLVLQGTNPVSRPAPIVERLKMASFYANLIQRIVFDRSYQSCFKRMVELKRILSQVSRCLESDPASIPLAEEDQAAFSSLRTAFQKTFGHFEFDQMAAWEEFDRVVTNADPYQQEMEVQRLFAEATGFKKRLLDLITSISAMQTSSDLAQESRQHVYAVFNSQKSSAAQQFHEEFLRSFGNDWSICLSLAESSPYPKVIAELREVIAGPKNPFNEQQARAIEAALARNPHFPRVDYSQIGSLFTLGASNGGHEIESRMVDFSPDGRRLLTASYDHTVHLFDVASKGLLHIFDQSNGGHDDIVQSAKFSPNGQLIATASRDGTVRVFDAQSYRNVFTLLNKNGGHKDWVIYAEISHCGRYLISAGWDKKVIITDLKKGQVVYVIDETNNGHKNHVRVASFSPNDRTILTAGDDATIRTFAWPTLRPQLVLSPENGGHQEAVLFATFNHQGTQVASTSDDRSVLVTDLSKAEVAFRLTGANGGFVDHVRAAAFTPDDSYLAMAGRDKTARVLKLADKTIPLVFGPEQDGHTNGLTFTTFNPQGNLLATASADGLVKILDFSVSKGGS